MYRDQPARRMGSMKPYTKPDTGKKLTPRQKAGAKGGKKKGGKPYKWSC